jgi:2-octaprenyl-6-methoxyphenol hydroxylase
MEHDVIILGGGLNGLATALALGGSRLPRPLNVLLLDKRDPRIATADMRGTALTLSTQNMLRVLGVWEGLSAHACEMRDVMVTDGGQTSLLNLTTPVGQFAVASMVENRKLNRALLDAVDQSPQITMRGGFELDRFENTPSRITLWDRLGERLTAALLVAADGRNSQVRLQLGIAVMLHDYGQTALGFSVALGADHHNRAEEHFSATGVFALLPLPGKTASVVWGTAPEDAKRLMALDDDAFNQALQIKIGNHLGAVTVTGKRQAFPLVKQIARELMGPRIALLGDAAHAIHPLAGLGLNLGFKDAAALADCVVAAFSRGGDIGSELVLQHYQEFRRFDTLATSWLMDGINGLFVNDDPILGSMRKLGLRLVDQMSLVKSTIMQQASGQSQENPRLLQGLLPG